MADDDRSIRVRLLAEVGSYMDGLRKASRATADFGREVTGHGKTVKADIEKVGHGALLMSAGVAAGLGLSAKAAIDWESAWAGVTKTVDGTAAQMAELEDGLRNLAMELPATHGEIAAVAEAAGALGIQRSAIEGFTRTMVDLGETTNLTADQAATAMARIANVMQTPQANIDRMGSTLVALGNAGASTESEILELTNRLAAAGRIAGLSEADVFAFGSALSSVGVEAEAGGSALSKVFTTISDAVKDGSDKLTILGRVAGLSAKEFAQAYERDAAGAIQQFIDGLGGMIEKGESLTPVLEALEFTDIRLANALKSTASAGELLADQLDLSRRAWEENTALADEAAKRYETFSAKAEMVRNQLVDLGIDVGQVVLPALSELLDVGSSVIRGFGELDGTAETVITAFGLISGAALGAVGVIGTLGPKYRDFKNALSGMGGLGSALAGNLNKATVALGAVGLAVGVYTYVLGQNAKRKQEAVDLAREYADAIREETGAYNENIDAVTARNLGDWGGASQLRELRADFDVLLTGIRESDDALALLSSQFNTGQLIDEFARELDEAGLSGTEFGDELLRLHGLMTSRQFDDFLAKLADLNGGYTLGAELAANLSEAQGGVGDSAEDAASGQRQLGRDLGLTTQEAEDAEKAIRDLLDAYRASVDPLFGMLDALDRNREAQAAQAEAAAEGAERIADAQRSLADAQDDLADARTTGDADAVAAATDRVAEAQRNLAEVQADAAITAEEQAAMNRDVAKSALDVEVAARELALAIETGTVSVDVAKQMLAEWVEQGLITAEQAEEVGKQFEIAAGKADAFAGDYVANAIANTEQAEEAFDRLYQKVKRVIDLSPYSIDVLVAEKDLMRQPRGAATGGVVGNTLGPPQPSDTMPIWATPGEGVVNLRGMSLLGPSGLDALNRGQMSSAMAAPVAQSVDYSRHVSLAPQFVLPAGAPEESLARTVFRLRHLAVELSAHG